jgi:hypothetical protein
MDPLSIGLMLGGGLLSGLFAPQKPSAPSPNRPNLPTPQRPDLPTPQRPQSGNINRPDLYNPQRPNLTAGQRPTMGQYLPEGWQAAQNQAYAALSNALGGGPTEAGGALYDSQKQRLQEARDEQLEWQKGEALRRGVYDSGINTENQNKTWEQYNQGLQQAAREEAMYNQSQKWNALNAILGMRPMGYDLYQSELGQHNIDVGRELGQYNTDLGNLLNMWYYGDQRDWSQYNTDLARLLSQYNIDTSNLLNQYNIDVGRELGQSEGDQAASDNLASALGLLMPVIFPQMGWR